MKPYKTVTIGLTRWQWQVLKASARAWRDRDVEAHAALMLWHSLDEVAREPEAEFEEPFSVPRRPLGEVQSWDRGQWPAEFKGTGQAGSAYRWHPRRWR